MAAACACPLAEIVDATRRMLELRRYPAWTERDVDWAARCDPRLAALLPSATCAAHPALFVVPEEALLVVVTDVPKPGTAPLRPLCDRDALEERCGVRHALIVAAHPVTTQTQHLLPAHVAVLSWVAVLTRPLDHESVPGHRRATADDLRAAGVSSRGARGLLPSLRPDDPIAQYLGLRVGEIVRIDRLDGSIYLRVVTPH